MTCEEAGCYEAAIISIRKDPFGKSDAMRHLCSHHAPRWLAVSGQVNEKAIGGSDVCHTCAAHVKVITEDLEPRIRALEAELAVEKMQHSVTIADEHESRSAFQHSIRALEAERDDVVEARGEMAKENVRLATEMAEWRELYEFGLNDRNELLARAQTAEAYAARNALRVIELEAALQLIGNELSLQADKGPAGEAFRALLKPTLPETMAAPGFCPECLMTGGHKLRCSKAETKRKCPECVYDVSNPFICERCGTPMGPTVAETTPKPITTFTGWIQGSCDNCGKSAREHVGISMGCPQAETFGVKP